MPQKRQINPRDITPILPNMFILEAETSGAYRFRLVGSALSDARGEDITGADFLQLQSENLRGLYKAVLDTALNTACGIAVGRTLMVNNDRQLRVLNVALPCLDSDGCTRFVVGVTEILGNRPLWSASETATRASARMVKCRYLDLGWGLPDAATSWGKMSRSA